MGVDSVVNNIATARTAQSDGGGTVTPAEADAIIKQAGLSGVSASETQSAFNRAGLGTLYGAEQLKLSRGAFNDALTKGDFKALPEIARNAGSLDAQRTLMKQVGADNANNPMAAVAVGALSDGIGQELLAQMTLQNANLTPAQKLDAFAEHAAGSGVRPEMGPYGQAFISYAREHAEFRAAIPAAIDKASGDGQQQLGLLHTAITTQYKNEIKESRTDNFQNPAEAFSDYLSKGDTEAAAKMLDKMPPKEARAFLDFVAHDVQKQKLDGAYAKVVDELSDASLRGFARGAYDANRSQASNESRVKESAENIDDGKAGYRDAQIMYYARNPTALRELKEADLSGGYAAERDSIVNTAESRLAQGMSGDMSYFSPQ